MRGGPGRAGRRPGCARPGEFLAGADGLDPAAVLRRLSERDRALAAGRDGEYVLWFEADLYDQLQIAQILAMLGDLGVAPGRVTLVCIGEYPGIAHFGGLGELEPRQLPGPAGRGHPADRRGPRPGGRRLGGPARPRPGGLGRIAASRSRELRFLGEPSTAWPASTPRPATACP
jgi:hypothetical protein